MSSNNRKQLLAKMWLIRHDPDPTNFWRNLHDDSDFVGAVRDNLHIFGPDDMAETLIFGDAPCLP